MITRKDIITFAQHIVRRNNGFPDRRLIHPRREWMIGMCGMLVLFAAGCGYASWLFFNTGKNIDQEVSAEETIVRYQEDAISAALKKYRERANSFNELNRGAGVFMPYPTEAETPSADSGPLRAE